MRRECKDVKVLFIQKNNQFNIFTYVRVKFIEQLC